MNPAEFSVANQGGNAEGAAIATMSYRALILTAVASLFALADAKAQNLLINGSFASPVIPGNQEIVLTGTQLTGWTIANTGTISLQSAAYATFYTNGAVTTQLLDLTGAGGSGGIITQTINSAIAGGTYHFSIDNYRYGTFTGQAFRVTIQAMNGNTVVGTLANQTFSTPRNVLTNVGFNFTNNTAFTSIRVTIQDISGSDTNASWVQNASIVLIPEPALWGAMGGGLAGLLIWRRRRKMREAGVH